MTTIEYFYAAHSLYAYIGARKLMEIAKAHGCGIVHRPMDLRAVVANSGAVPFSKRSKAHIDYFFGREMQRWAEERNVPILPHFPRQHAKDITLPNCLLLAAIATGADIDGLSHRLLEAHWVEDADLSDPETLRRLASDVGLDGEKLLAVANSHKVLAQYEVNTQEAISRSVFGSPTYFVDGDMFYGQDRLEMVERALKQPYARTSVGAPQ